MDAIYQKEVLISREAKRKYEFESQKVIEDFDNINQSFLTELFDDEIHSDRITYDLIYQSHLQWWETSYDWYKKYGKLKYTIIDPYWFMKNYQPITL